MKTRRYMYGLSLVEMLIVVAVIALLAAMVIGLAGRIDDQSKERALASSFALLDGALEEYKEFTGHFPIEATDPNISSAQDLAAVRSESLYRDLYSIPDSRKILQKVSEKLIRNDFDTGIIPPIPEIYDPWDTPLDYRYVDGNHFPLLVSAGPDKTFGNTDDITNR